MQESVMKVATHIQCGFTRIFHITLAIMLLAVLTAPDVLACHQKRGEPMPHGKETSCDTGGDQFPTNPAFAEAWFDDLFVSILPQLFNRSPSSGYAEGDYVADQPSIEEIRITTNSLSKTVVSGKRHGDLCMVMDDTTDGNGPFYGHPETFNFGWTDNCTDGRCAIEISLSFGEGVAELTGGRSDRMEMLMHASVSGDDLLSMDEPFLSPRSIKTSSVELDFKKPGSVRSLVQCRLAPQGVGAPTLKTMP
jgi:hypothetical protein